MMIQAICQWLVVTYLTVAFFGAVHSDFHPHPAKQAAGYAGFVVTTVVIGMLATAIYFAGGLPWSPI